MLALIWWCVKFMIFVGIVALVVQWFVTSTVDSWRRMKAGPPQRKIEGEQ